MAYGVPCVMVCTCPFTVIVAGAVAVAPVAGCDSAAFPVSDAAAKADATGSPDGADAGADMAAALDTSPKIDGDDDAEQDGYPDGIRG